jgi:hypothetical protein
MNRNRTGTGMCSCVFVCMLVCVLSVRVSVKVCECIGVCVRVCQENRVCWCVLVCICVRQRACLSMCLCVRVPACPCVCVVCVYVSVYVRVCQVHKCCLFVCADVCLCTGVPVRMPVNARVCSCVRRVDSTCVRVRVTMCAVYVVCVPASVCARVCPCRQHVANLKENPSLFSNSTTISWPESDDECTKSDDGNHSLELNITRATREHVGAASNEHLSRLSDNLQWSSRVRPKEIPETILRNSSQKSTRHYNNYHKKRANDTANRKKNAKDLNWAMNFEPKTATKSYKPTTFQNSVLSIIFSSEKCVEWGSPQKNLRFFKYCRSWFKMLFFSLRVSFARISE